MAGQPGRQGGCPHEPAWCVRLVEVRQTERMMRRAEVVDTAHPVHAGPHGLQAVRGVATATGQDGQALMEGGIEPLDVGGVDLNAAVREAHLWAI